MYANPAADTGGVETVALLTLMELEQPPGIACLTMDT